MTATDDAWAQERGIGYEDLTTKVAEALGWTNIRQSESGGLVGYKGGNPKEQRLVPPFASNPSACFGPVGPVEWLTQNTWWSLDYDPREGWSASWFDADGEPRGRLGASPTEAICEAFLEAVKQ